MANVARILCPDIMMEKSFFERWSAVIRNMAIKSWYCDRCQVEVRQLHCPHCGKLELDPR